MYLMTIKDQLGQFLSSKNCYLLFDVLKVNPFLFIYPTLRILTLTNFCFRKTHQSRNQKCKANASQENTRCSTLNNNNFRVNFFARWPPKRRATIKQLTASCKQHCVFVYYISVEFLLGGRTLSLPLQFGFLTLFLQLFWALATNIAPLPHLIAVTSCSRQLHFIQSPFGIFAANSLVIWPHRHFSTAALSVSFFFYCFYYFTFRFLRFSLLFFFF